MRVLTSALLILAHRLMPQQRREWLQAMRAESAYLSAPVALGWALQALVTATRERLIVMNTGNFHVSRWVMLVETLGVFGLLTFAWLEVTFGAAGVIHLTPAIFDKLFLGHPGGGYIAFLHLSAAVVGLIGPVGLLLGLRYVLLGILPRNRALLTVMMVSILLYLVAGVAGLLIGPSGYGLSIDAGILLLLSVAVLFHLMRLAHPNHAVQPSA